MLKFVNPFIGSDNPSHGKILLETQKLKAHIVEQIINNTLDSSINVKLLMRVLESLDNTAICALKQEAVISEDEVSRTATAIIAKILTSNKLPEFVNDDIITSQPDPGRLPDIIISEGELMTGVEVLDINDFYDDNADL